jgi:flagellar biosynthesis protein FliQ
MGLSLNLDQATSLVQHTLIVAAPMLLIGLVVGVTISIVQAVTQIQEQTLSFVPKISAMIFSAALLMPWIGVRLLEYARAIFSGGQLP